MTTHPGEDEMPRVSAQLSAEPGGRLAYLQPQPDAVAESSGEATDSSTWGETIWRQKWDRFFGALWASSNHA